MRIMVPVVGLEPTHLSVHDFESRSSAIPTHRRTCGLGIIIILLGRIVKFSAPTRQRGWGAWESHLPCSDSQNSEKCPKLMCNKFHSSEKLFTNHITLAEISSFVSRNVN